MPFLEGGSDWRKVIIMDAISKKSGRRHITDGNFSGIVLERKMKCIILVTKTKKE
jgi:hypothetical protein